MFLCLYLSYFSKYYNQSNLFVIYHPGKLGQSTEYMCRPWWSAASLLILMACSACFLIVLRTTSPRVAPPTVSRVLPHLSAIKKNAPQDAQGLIWWGYPLEGGSLLPNNSSLCESGHQTSQHSLQI